MTLPGPTPGKDGLAGHPDGAAHLIRALDASPDLVLVGAPGRERVQVNVATARLLGLVGDDVELALLDQRAPAWARDRVRAEAVPALGTTGVWEGELALHDAEGDLVPLSVVAVAVRDDDGTIVSVVVVARDVSSRTAREGQLERQATHDPLTGLPNRTLLLDRLAMALGRARRHGSRAAVLYLDLDGFKPVNDALGHAAGDLLLAEVARRIEGAIRPGDTAARVGGDEFVVVCEDLTGRSEADAVVRRITAEVGRPVRIDHDEVTVTASIGLALSDGSSTPDDLIGRADAAMYAAKGQRG